MIIKTVLKKLREADLFEFLVRSSRDSTVQICRTLLNKLNTEPSISVKQLFRSAEQHDAKITLSDVERIVKSLQQAKVMVNDNGNLKFKDRVVTASNHEQGPRSAVAKSASASNRSQDSNKGSISSNYLSTSSGSSSLNDQPEVQSSSSVSDFLAGNPSSPLSAYFASVNSDLNDDYLRNSGYSSSSHGDHLVNRSNLDWLDASSASSSAEQAAKFSKQDNHLDLAKMTVSDGSSAVDSSSAKSVRARSSLNFRSSSSSASRSRSYHAEHPGSDRFRLIAKSLFKKVSFMSLMSHPARVQQIAKAEFNLVVASRRYKGIKQADDLFKYEFKMNYQKFGKIGNRINNLLMKKISSHDS